jgi:hypothetical protein
MRTTPTLLLILGFAGFATVAVIGAASKIPSLRSHSFLGMNAYALPATTTVVAPDPNLIHAEVWSRYRWQVKACVAEPANIQDACLQQARRERKQSLGFTKKSFSVKPSVTANKTVAAG